MTNNNVRILIPELKNKKCEIYIANFLNYKNCTNPTELQNVIDQVNKAKLDTKFEAVEFDFNTGLLYTKCKGL